MKKNLLLLALSTFAAASAFAAGMDGKWHGTGAVTMTGTPAMHCERVEADLLETASTFELRQFDYNCSGMEVKSSAISLEKRGSDFYLGSDKVGQSRGGVIEFTLHDPSGASMGFRFERIGEVLKAVNTLAANGFNQELQATLQAN